MPDTSNVDRLVDAGMIEDASHLSDDETKKVNQLTDEEVEQLIHLWGRLGKPKPGKPPKGGPARPMIF